MGLGYTDCGHLVVASGEEGPGPQVLEAVDPGVDIITGDRMGPGPTQVPNICIGELTDGLAGRGLGLGPDSGGDMGMWCGVGSGISREQAILSLVQVVGTGKRSGLRFPVFCVGLQHHQPSSDIGK